MRTELLHAVAQVIEAHCWWVRPVATYEYQPYCAVHDEHLIFQLDRCLTLEVTHSRGEYYVGHRWHISEDRLDTAFCELLREVPQCRDRCYKGRFKPEDVQTLIQRASYGIIDLDLVDDDYQPRIE